MTFNSRLAQKLFLLLLLSALTASAIDELVPNCANEDDPGFTLTVLGEELSDDDNIRWNSRRLTTTFVSSTKLLAQVPASLLRNAGTAKITLECCPGEGFLEFTIHPDSPAPLVGDDTATTNRNGSIEIDVLRNDRDTDGTIDAASLAIQMGPENGGVEVNSDGTITYQPDADFTGTDNFTYTVKDHVCAISEPATVTVTVLDQAGVSCMISPRNTHYPLHRPNELLLQPGLSPHVLTIKVTDDGETPASPIAVMLSATHDLFPGPRGLPSSDQSTVDTDVDGKAAVEVNPVAPEVSRTTELTATGLLNDTEFRCRALILTGGGSLTTLFTPEVSKLQPPDQAGVLAATIPLAFEANEGQADSKVRYLARGPGYSLLLGPEEATLVAKPTGKTSAPPDAVQMRLIDAATSPRITPQDPLPGRSHYLVGSDANNWTTEVAHYGKVEYEGVYPGVDLVYYGNPGGLEYDFIVSPGADPNRIAVTFEGADEYRLDEDGALIMQRASGIVSLKKPYAYQLLKGLQQEVAANYVIDGNRVGFALAAYDRAERLVIDPVISYASYLGGTGGEIITGIARDDDGNLYVTGTTTSANLPTLGGPGLGFGSGFLLGTDAFVSKFDPSGTTLIYSTYIGGTGDDIGAAIAVDSRGGAYITGSTTSNDFPTFRALQAESGGGPGLLRIDAFAAKLSSNGSNFVYSTYLGGSGADLGTSIDVDLENQAHIAGSTTSTDFPVVDAFQAEPQGRWDGFLVKLEPLGQGLVYGTYLGGDQPDSAQQVRLDAAANAYVVGYTESANFPVMDFVQEENGGSKDAFVTKFDATGDLAFSTFLGGGADDVGFGIAIDDLGHVYATGSTGSPGFPVVNAVQPDLSGDDSLGFDAFVTKLDVDGTEIAYSTLLGGSSIETGLDVVVGSSGHAYVMGETSSTDFPTTEALQLTLKGPSDAFVARLNEFGAALVQSTFLGGSANDAVAAGVLDGEGGLYVVGPSGSLDAPVTVGSFQPVSAGDSEGFIAHIVEGDSPPSVATIQAASGALVVAPASIASGFGDPLAPGTEAATERPLPTELLGVSVRITDSAGAIRLSPLFVVTPGQINFFVDPATALGLALVEVLEDGIVVATGTVQVAAVAPGIFTANADGQGVPAARFLRFRGGEQTAEGLVFDANAVLGEREALQLPFGDADELLYVALFGTGMRAGSQITATLDGEEIPISAVVGLDAFTGLDQVNIGQIPRSFIGRGIVELIVFVDGVITNTVLLHF